MRMLRLQLARRSTSEQLIVSLSQVMDDGVEEEELEMEKGHCFHTTF